jgi:hypothetical protein
MLLIPLRIPMGYAICFNKFFDVEPVPCQDGDGFLHNCEYFTQDILQIVKMRIEHGGWVIPSEDRVIIDLGWYPDSRVEGQYKLVLANKNWEVIRESYSKDRFEIRDTIEEWMA